MFWHLQDKMDIHAITRYQGGDRVAVQMPD